MTLVLLVAMLTQGQRLRREEERLPSGLRMSGELGINGHGGGRGGRTFNVRLPLPRGTFHGGKSPVSGALIDLVNPPWLAMILGELTLGSPQILGNVGPRLRADGTMVTGGGPLVGLPLPKETSVNRPRGLGCSITGFGGGLSPGGIATPTLPSTAELKRF